MIPVRVLVVTPWFPSARKPGAGAFMLRDVDLLRVNHEVTVLHLAEAKDIDPEEPRRTLTPSGAVVLRQPFNPVNPVAIHQASRTIRNLLEEADVVHTMAMHALLPVRIAWPSVPWVHTEHWSGLMQERLPLRKWVGLTAYRSSLACPDAVAAVGRSLARAVERTRSGSAAIIPNHVVLGSPDRLPDPPTTAGPGPLRIVAVGNLIEHKGPLITLETLAELRERGVEADLTWIGAGPLEAEVQRRVDEMRLADSVNMVGQIAPAEIPDRLLAAQVFVLPTASETFGVAFAEALGQGLPAVATGHGGHLDFSRSRPRESRRTGLGAQSLTRCCRWWLTQSDGMLTRSWRMHTSTSQNERGSLPTPSSTTPPKRISSRRSRMAGGDPVLRRDGAGASQCVWGEEALQEGGAVGSLPRDFDGR